MADTNEEIPSEQQQQQQQQQQRRQQHYPEAAHQPFETRDEEIVQVVYQSDQHGSLVGVESTSLLSGPPPAGLDSNGQPSAADGSNYVAGQRAFEPAPASAPESGTPLSVTGSHQHEQLSRAASTLPSVAEESTSSGALADANGYEPASRDFASEPADETSPAVAAGLSSADESQAAGGRGHEPPAGSDPGRGFEAAGAPIYSTVNKQPSPADVDKPPIYENQVQATSYGALCGQPQQQEQEEEEQQQPGDGLQEDSKNLIDYQDENQPPYGEHESSAEGNPAEVADLNEEITSILSRHKAGAVEKGSFRNNFRKKLGLSVSTNENDLTAYRRKFLDLSGEPNQVQQQQQQNQLAVGGPADNGESEQLGSLPSKFKRTHSVSFNVDSSRSNRHSVDIRNLPSYLTHKRASIVDVARGAMSSLMSSLGSGGGGGGANSASGSAISGSYRRDSSHQDEEPIFEEPIAPTLSLGQRVAMVRNSGAEFGTVGWIGQLPDVDDDWIVGVIFDNMIGDCDGAYNGVRYFYARPNFAMFVPLTSLTKTDNYIGRPETGTMLSRMSVSLKPGQLISIQRSSIRLQHCFLNAPHQRVGHDVRAVSNRLHCQCHNCGPCAHLTKQGRINALPQFGAHHLPHRKKNSLAHAAVEMLAHHHHHFHEEEEDHEEKDYEFGDNAAHACNFVRYSCCQQSGQPGHEFSSDCGMVRPELLDNLIHAPKAPARRSRPRRPTKQSRAMAKRQQQAPLPSALEAKPRLAAIGGPTANSTLETTTAASNPTGTLDSSSQLASTDADLGGGGVGGDGTVIVTGDEGLARDGDGDDSSYLSTSNSSSSSSSSRASSPVQPPPVPYNYYTYDTSSFRPTTGVYNTIDSQISFMDQQRFVYRRDSAAFLQSPKPSNWSDDYEASNSSSVVSSDPLGFKRILRCLGCMRHRIARRRSRPRRKLSFKDKVLEYRRRQSTFVPSTLAKPHEDFASHGIILPGSSSRSHSHLGQQSAPAGPPGQPRRAHPNAEFNSDYSSCSRSSCSSSRSNSPPNFRPHQGSAAAAITATTSTTIATVTGKPQLQADASQYFSQQAASVTLNHEHSIGNDQLKSLNQVRQAADQGQQDYEPQLNYGDYSYGDGYGTYAKTKSSGDSALTDFAYTDSTHKSNCSSDTLKCLVDQSINDQVGLPGPLPPGPNGEFVSPPSSASANREEAESPDGARCEVSSLTASTVDNANGDDNEEEELTRQKLEDLNFESNEDNH